MLVATGVNAGGQREILGVEIGSAEDGATWTAFLRGLVARGLSGVKLVVSDAHVGLKAAIGAVLDGAAWQRCRTHFMRNLLAKVPRHAQPMIASLVRTIFAQERPEDAWAQLERVTAQLRSGRYLDAAELLEDAAGDVLAYTAFPRDVWKKIWSNNPQERLNREIRRRTGGRDLPQPRRPDPPGRRRPGRAARRMGRRPALHQPRSPARQPDRARHRQHRPEGAIHSITVRDRLTVAHEEGAKVFSYTT